MRISSLSKAVPAVAACLIAMTACAPAEAAQGDRTVWADISVDRAEVYRHETFTLTLKLSSLGVRLDQTFELTGMPPPNELRHGPFSEFPVQREQWGTGVREVRTFKTEARAPLPGSIVIAPQIQAAVLTRSEGLIGYTWVRTQRLIKVDPVRLNVKPLPVAGRPDDFSGAVGQFKMDVEISPVEIAPGELLTVRTHIRGKGYTEEMKPPRVKAAGSFKIYEPKKVESDGDGVMSFGQVLIPQGPAADRIASVSFSYFDPQAGAYRSLTRGPFPLTLRSAARPVEQRPFRPAETEREAGGISAPAVSEEVGDTETGEAGRAYRLTGMVLAAWAGAAFFLAAALRAAFVTLAAFRKRRRRALMASAAFLAALAGALCCLQWALSGGGTAGAARAGTIRREAARLAPGRAAMETFNIPAGAQVEILETHGDWTKIAYGARRGWIRREALRNGGAAPEAADSGAMPRSDRPLSLE